MEKWLSGLKHFFAKETTCESSWVRIPLSPEIELITQLVECPLDKRKVSGSNPLKLKKGHVAQLDRALVL